jgi:hypothetical protein
MIVIVIPTTHRLQHRATTSLPSNGAAAGAEAIDSNGEMESPEKPKLLFINCNLFFKLEHAYVSGEIHEGRRPSSVGEGRTGKSSIAAIQPRDPTEGSQLLPRSRHTNALLHLKREKHWYSARSKQSHKHCKTHGFCSFVELTSMISAYWKTIDTTDPYKKNYLIKLASDELEDYKRKND